MQSSSSSQPLDVPVAPQPEVAIEKVPCEDFLAFQDILKKMRAVDDKIIYALNTSIPTVSFRESVDAGETCRKLHDELKGTMDRRELALKRCAKVLGDKITELKNEKDQRPADIGVMKAISKQQTTLRLIRSELYVEEILRDRTFKVFFDRCRHFFPHPSSTS